MTTAKRIMKYMAAEPFRPFRITLADGKTFNIQNSGMIAIG